MTDKKRKYILIGLGIAIILVLGIGITYAYFEARIDQGAQGDVNVTGDTVDNLQFNVTNDINLNINQFNFGSGAGNLTSNAKATASLRANSTKNTATYNYYVYFQIDSNDFIYTTTDHKPEIVLTITDPTGSPVTSIEGLTYVTATNADGTTVSGFDITTASGLFTIESNYEIISNSSTEATTQEWNMIATFINLATDQEGNTGKTMSGKVMIQKDTIKISDICAGKNMSTCIAKNYNLDSSIYHHDGTITATVANADTGVNVGDVIDSGDGSYRYAGSSDTTNNYVCFGQDDATGTYASGWCDTENLYRIIGVFNDSILDDSGNPTMETEQRVKLIKASIATSTLLGTDGDYASGTNYYWNKTNYSLAYNEKGRYSLWSYSELNKTNLNKNYLTNIGTKWSGMIDESIWYIGGLYSANGTESTAKKAYTYELGENKNLTTPYEPAKAKVGLMYLSEYYYSADPTYWTYKGYAYDSSNGDGCYGCTKDYREAKETNWMLLGVYGVTELTISPYLNSLTDVFSVKYGGDVNCDGVAYSYNIGVRPTFSLKPSITFVGGTGTATDPYRIEV